jgi:hypothetical protein
MFVQTSSSLNFSSAMSSPLTPQKFYEAYCWAVYSRALGESRMIDLWPDLARIYQNFDPYTVNRSTASELEEWLDPETTLGPSQCALMIQLFGWEQFCQQFIKTADSKQTLATLRGMDWTSVQQLGRLLDMAWAD